jgi:hypothetical protein
MGDEDNAYDATGDYSDGESERETHFVVNPNNDQETSRNDGGRMGDTDLAMDSLSDQQEQTEELGSNKRYSDYEIDRTTSTTLKTRQEEAVEEACASMGGRDYTNNTEYELEGNKLQHIN